MHSAAALAASDFLASNEPSAPELERLGCGALAKHHVEVASSESVRFGKLRYAVGGGLRVAVTRWRNPRFPPDDDWCLAAECSVRGIPDSGDAGRPASQGR